MSNIEPEIVVSISGDEYVPIAIEIGACEHFERLYWRIVPDSRTLVEVGLSKFGKLCSFTLTAINPSAVTLNKDSFKDRDERIGTCQGVPCFDVSIWQLNDEFGSMFVNESIDVALVVGTNWCGVYWAKEKTISRIVTLGGLCCLIDSCDNLIGFELRGCSDYMLRTLAEQAI